MLTTFLILAVLAGCQPGASREYLAVDFEPETDLKYRFVSERQTSLKMSTAKTATRKAKSQTTKMTEKMELVIAYKAVADNEYGRTTVHATCQSAKVTRTGNLIKSSSKDAIEGLSGKTFTFRVLANGQIEDHSSLDKLVKELGKNAFGAPRGGNKVKNPDMIKDFIAMQWYLWDSISMIDDPQKGVELGQTWTAKQMMPMPMRMAIAKDVTYTLTEIKDSDTGPMAVIDSTFQRSDEPVENLPDPYDGQKYMMKGMFALLSGYGIISFQGSGKQIFDIDRGVITADNQQHTIEFKVKFLLPLGDTPPILKIDQKMTIELLE
jgi:hypothetical protein